MITIVKGSDSKLKIKLQIKSSCKSYDPFNLTGKTVTVKYRDSTNTLITKSGSPAITLTDAVLGKFTLLLDETSTANINTGTFNFDVHVDDAGDLTIFKIVGKVTVVAGV